MKKITQKISIYIVLTSMVFLLPNCGRSEKSKNKKIAALEQEASMAMANSDFQTAVSKYKEVMKIAPKKESARNNLAVIYARFLDKPEEAKKLWESLLKDFPKNAAYINNLAGIYRSQKKYDKAVELYEKSKKLNNTYHMPYYNIGFIELERKNYKKAEKEFKKAYELTKKDTTVIDYYAYSMILNGKYDKAGQFLKNMIDKFPKSTTLIVRYLRLLERMGNLNEMDSLLNKISKERTLDFLEIAEKIELAFKRKSSPDELSQLLGNTIAEIKPEIARWYKPLIEARIEGAKGNTDKAITDLKKLSGLIPKNQTFFEAIRCHAISELFSLTGNKLEADKWLKKSIALAPEMYFFPKSDTEQSVNKASSEKPASSN